MSKRNNCLYKKIIEEVGHCELCGSKRGLEAHHVIPLVVDWFIPGINLDIEENIIVVCSACHGKLTNKSLCTKIGLARAKMKNVMSKRNADFYQMCLDEIDGDNYALSARDVMDIHDEWLKKYGLK